MLGERRNIGSWWRRSLKPRWAAGEWEIAHDDGAPLVVRWPGHIEPGTVKNQIFASLDWLPTLVNDAGGPKGDSLKKQIEAGQYPGIVKTTLDGTRIGSSITPWWALARPAG
jgi:hypothetical protein